MASPLTRSLRRIAASLLLAASVLFTLPVPAAAQQQPGFVGTWSFSMPDGFGGQNFMWFTYSPDGQYQMVSTIQGGRHNGSIIQRWGNYQFRSTGPNLYQIAVNITGGAPTQICAPGQGCTAVRGIQQQMNLTFHTDGETMRQGDGSIFHRSAVPPQLQARMAGTRTIAPVPQSPVIQNNTNGTNNNAPIQRPPGVGNQCDNAQQNRICTINSGRIYIDNRGCQVCAGP
jgi:hypothetical protein